MDAWHVVEEEGYNPLVELLTDRLPGGMGAQEIAACLEKGAYNLGDAPERAKELAEFIRAEHANLK